MTAIVDASLDRLGVCNRLNLALVDREAAGLAAGSSRRARGAASRWAGRPGQPPSCRSRSWTSRLGHEWASDAERVSTVTLDIVDDLDEAVRIANTETSALAAGIVAEDAEAAERFFSLYRGTAAFWHATHAVHGRLRADRHAGDRDQRRLGARARAGPSRYRDLWLRQYRVVGDGTQHR